MIGKKRSSPESIAREIRRLSAGVIWIIKRNGIHSLRNQHADPITPDDVQLQGESEHYVHQSRTTDTAGKIILQGLPLVDADHFDALLKDLTAREMRVSKVIPYRIKKMSGKVKLRSCS